jgi:hypothetical protein
MNDGASAALLNGSIGARLLRDRGRSREWVARQIVGRRLKGLQRLLADPEAVRPAGRTVGISVSLTSWLPRLEVLPLVLLGLVEQTVRPSAIDVWLTAEDEALLDSFLKAAFARHGVRFRTCDDLGPHKKWLPLVESGVRGAFVICDDDILYPCDWLERLTLEDRADAYVGIKCRRMRWSPDGALLPYVKWDKDVKHGQSPSRDLFITGCGGAIIHPDRLGNKFRDRQKIANECPRADDIWLKAAHVAAGIPCYKTKYSFPCLEIPGTMASGLMPSNVDRGENDAQMLVLREVMRQNV